MDYSVYISYSVGNNPDAYDQQFNIPAELDLCEVFEGIDAETETVFCEDLACEAPA